MSNPVAENGRGTPDSGVPEVPFTVDADLDLGRAAAPWLRDHCADVVVRRGNVPEALSDVEAQGAAWEYAQGRLLVRPPGMRFLVEGGDSIRYAAQPGVEEIDIRLFLMGSAWGALVLQRGLLPLHASAVSNGRSVVGFTGHPGAGKSTLAAALASQGREFFADDVLVLDPEAGDAYPRCWSCKDLKLWPDAVRLTGTAAGNKIRTAPGHHKRYATPRVLSPHVLGQFKELYLLVTGSRDRPSQVEEVQGLQHVQLASTAVYRRPYAVAIVGQQRLFQQIVRITRAVRAYRYRRYVHPSRFEDGVAYIADKLPL